MDKLKHIFSELASSLNSKIYLVNHFDDIRNRIDLECQSFLNRDVKIYGERVGFIKAISNTYKNEGFSGFFKGYTASILRVFIGQSINFGTYEILKYKFVSTKKNSNQIFCRQKIKTTKKKVRRQKKSYLGLSDNVDAIKN